MATRPTPHPDAVRTALHALGFTTEDAVLAFQRAWDLPATGALDPTASLLAVDVLAAQEIGQRLNHPAPSYAVIGTVRSAAGEAAPQLTVQLVEPLFRGENALGSGATDAAGKYQIAYPPVKPGPTGPRRTLLVRVLDGGKTAAESAAQAAGPPLLEIDLVVDPGHLHAPTEIERLLADVAPLVGKVAAADLGEGDPARDVTFLSGATGWAPERLVQLVVASRLAALSRIAAPFFYALLRQRTLLGTDASRSLPRFAIDLSTPAEPLLRDAARLPPATVRQAVAAAIEQRIVPPSLLGDLDGILATLAKSAAAPQAVARTALAQPVVDFILANLVAGTIQQLAELLQQDFHSDPWRLAGQIDQIHFVHPGGTSATALPAAAPGGQAPPAATSPVSSTAAFAADLAAAGATPALPQAAAMARLLRANPQFDLATGNVDQLLRGRAAAAVSAAETARLRQDLKTAQRVFKLAPSHRQAAALLDAGLRSASHVAAMGKRRFVAHVTGGGTFTAAEAEATFHKASDVHLGAAFLAAQLHTAGTGAAVAAIASPELAAKLQLVSQDNPNLRNLFALTDQCECSHCGSVTGPAAYLVDVLQFLKNRHVVDTTAPPTTPPLTAKEALFLRRPDLGDIDLSCDNSDVPLPYIDLVCEVLEQAVAPDPGFTFPKSGTSAIAAGSLPPDLLAALQAQGLPFTTAGFVQGADAKGNFYARDAKVVCKLTPAATPGATTWTVLRLRQTFSTAAELAAAPEYVNGAAYAALQGAKIAFHLPFDLFHEEARVYFSQLGMRREELMRALAVGGLPPTPRDVAAAALGISDGERQLIGSADPTRDGQAQYWNTPKVDPAGVVNNVDVFLTRTELAYADLQNLLARQFINPGNQLVIQHSDASCDTTKKTIAHLDDAALDRIHRFLRLRRRLGWDMTTLDGAIMAARLGVGQLTDDPFLVRVADLVRLDRRLNLGIPELIVYYGLIPTEGQPSRYAQLFESPAASGKVDPALQRAAVQANESQPAGSQKHLGAVAVSLALALGTTPGDMARLITALAASPRGDVLSFANLAVLYSQVSLARALGLAVGDFLILADLTGIDPLASPADTLRFVAADDKLAAAGVAPADLQFLLAYKAVDLDRRKLGDAAIAALLAPLQAKLLATYTADRSPFDPALTPDENKTALRAVVGRLPGVTTAQLASLEAVVDNTYPDPAPAPKAFLDGLLGPFLDKTDTKAIDDLQAALAATPKDGPFEAARKALIQALLDRVSRYLYGQARDAAVVAAVAAWLALDATRARVLLQGVRIAAGAGPTLLEVLGADSLIGVHATPPGLPPITAAALPDQWAATQLLRQVALFTATLPLSTDDLRWLLANAPGLGWLRLDQLPYPQQPPAAAVPFAAWDQLQDAIGLFQRYPPVVNPADPGNPLALRAVLTSTLDKATTPVQVLDLLAAVTGWDRTVLGGLDSRFHLSSSGLASYRLPATYLRLEAAVTQLRRLGLDVTAGAALVVPQLTGDNAQALRQALRARTAEADWLGTLGQVYGPLREQKRDALVAWLLALAKDPSFASSDDLFDHFLLDVEMSSCQPTSRIVSAHGTVQLFVQRCLLGVEPAAVADATADDGWNQWQWMQAYRVWQANREVFLYPENFLDEPLRDDKSEPFVDFEKALQQNSLTDDSITAATIDYLEALDGIAFLEVVALCYDQDAYVLHVFARTKGGDPPVYYHRRFIQERTWTPWQKVALEIKGDHLVAFLRNGRLHLAWPVFTAQAGPDQDLHIPVSSDQQAPKTKQAWQIQIAISELQNGAWSPAKTSQGSVLGQFDYSDAALPAKERYRFVPWEGARTGFSILATFPEPATDVGIIASTFLGGFEMTGCKGYPVAYREDSFTFEFLPQFRGATPIDERFVEDFVDKNELSIMTATDLKWEPIFARTPDVYRVTCPQQVALPDFLVWLGQRVSAPIHFPTPLPLPLGTLMPFFYEDGNHNYVVVPGFSPPPPLGSGPPAGRRTYSDVLRLVQTGVRLVTPYLDRLKVNHTQADVDKAWSELQGLQEWKDLSGEVATYANLGYDLLFANFYHPLVCALRATLYRDGVGALMARATQLQTTAFDANAAYQPVQPTPPAPPLVRLPDPPAEAVDFDLAGAYSDYNWEIFFHLPISAAVRLSRDRQFAAAMKWFHYVFHPFDASADKVPQKYWQTAPFYRTQDYGAQRIDTILAGLAADPTGKSIPELAFAVEQWRENPFEPFLVARSRTVAFQLAVVMKYIDNLIAWGDSLFAAGTLESVNQATQLYVLADKLLGPRPRLVPPVQAPRPETYDQLEAKIDLFGNALVDLENAVADLKLPPHRGAGGPPSALTLSSLYFCIPPNPTLLGYWDTVADRLFKIRHCQDLSGVARTLALFAPPIDPRVLVAALAQGISLADVVQGLNAPLPFYRFTTMAQKAAELAQLVVSFGNELAQALEKRDAEALARLRATQELAVLDAVRLVKEQQVADAQAQIEVLQRSLELTSFKSQYYHSRLPINVLEALALTLTQDTLVLQAAAIALDQGAAEAHLIPSVSVGIDGFGGSPSATVSFGGENVAGAQAGSAGVARARGGVLQTIAGLVATLGSYQRRQEEWDFQGTVADKELLVLGQQQDQARIKVAIAADDLAAHQQQIRNAQQTDQFLRGKFTNQELYEHLADQLGGVYFRAYQLALDLAHKAERCFQHEIGSEQSFIGYGYWDDLRKGLLAGHRLLSDLRQMEVAYLDQNRRDLELTKHVSLLQLDPLALWQLKVTGACTFSLPEAIFDLDHPGHYRRRLKHVAITVPCVAGPYSSVGCTLSLVGNRYRDSTAGSATGSGYPETPPGGDPRFVYNAGAIQSIATSQGQNDGGLFELNFHDERYLPFENAGAISSWRLELPPVKLQQFDYGTIADVVLHVRYTARDGGSAFATTVGGQLVDQLGKMLVDAQSQGLFQAIDLRRELPDAWHLLQQGGSAPISISIGSDRLPFFTRGHRPQIDQVTWLAEVGGNPATYPLSAAGQTLTLTPISPTNTMLIFVSPSGKPPITFDTPFTLGLVDQKDTLEELVLILHYKLSA